MKNALAVIAGLLAAFVVFTAIQGLGSILHPFPKDLNMQDPEAVKEYVKTLPASALVLVLAGYMLGSLVAGLVVGKVSKSPKRTLPLITGIILTAGAIANLAMLPHPVWFMVINVIIYIPFVLAGHRRSMKRVAG
jgi:MFS family permease